MKRFVMAAVVFAAAIGLSVASHAATVSTNVNVGVSVTPQCSVVAADLSFPSWNGSSAVSGSGTVTVNCTNGTPYEIALNGGINSLQGSKRVLGNTQGVNFNYGLGTGQIPYTITKNGSGEWGDNGFGDTYTPGTPLSGTGTGSNQNHSISGQIAAMPSFTGGAGSYFDFVTVTVHH